MRKSLAIHTGYQECLRETQCSSMGNAWFGRACLQGCTVLCLRPDLFDTRHVPRPWKHSARHDAFTACRSWKSLNRGEIASSDFRFGGLLMAAPFTSSALHSLGRTGLVNKSCRGHVLVFPVFPSSSSSLFCCSRLCFL